MTLLHLEILLELLSESNLEEVLLLLVSSGYSQIRLKGLSICNTILKSFREHFISEENIFNRRKLVISRLMINIIRFSLGKYNDPKLQFNIMLMMDYFFQNVLVTPPLPIEIERYRSNKLEPLSQISTIDILTQTLPPEEKVIEGGIILIY